MSDDTLRRVDRSAGWRWLLIEGLVNAALVGGIVVATELRGAPLAAVVFVTLMLTSRTSRALWRRRSERSDR